jgi:hypothetical protein
MYKSDAQAPAFSSNLKAPQHTGNQIAREEYPGFFCFVTDPSPNDVSFAEAALPFSLGSVTHDFTVGMVSIAL